MSRYDDDDDDNVDDNDDVGRQIGLRYLGVR
jgi:hypothetical protein